MEIACCSFVTNTLWLLFFFIVFSILTGIYKYCLRKGKNLKVRYSQDGKDTYACVTGATSGIGKGFAFELAERGFNILLVSRSEKKLKDVQQELKTSYPEHEVNYVVADFGSNQSIQFYERVCAKINEYDVGLLVNNAGIQYIGVFNQVSAAQHLHAMEVNMLPYAMLARFIIPVMLERNTRSGIIFVSSLGIEMSCTPINAIYMATKAFDDSLSRGLAYEFESKIDIMSLKPGYVESNMSKMKKGLEAISAKESASSALNQLGFLKATSGHWSQQIQSFFLVHYDKLPNFAHLLLFNYIMKKEEEIIRKQQ